MEESITQNKLRPGNITNSQIYRICGTPAVQKTYIAEKNAERKMRLSLDKEAYSQPMAWGKICEMYVHQNKLSTNYKGVGDKTLHHPTIDYWKGSPDFDNPSEKIIAECKAYERKKFAAYADAILEQDTDLLRVEFAEEYWQMVGNACILGYDKIQPILFMPYFSDLPNLAAFTEEIDVAEQWQYKFIYDAVENKKFSKLVYLENDGYYKDFNTCILDVPAKDKDFLTNRVLEVGKLLKPFYVK